MGDVITMSQEILVAGEKSDQEWIDEGKNLVKLAGRGLGEWFNGVKRGRGEAGAIMAPDRKSAKQIVDAIPDMSYSTARTAGQIVEAFLTEESQRGFLWTECMKMLPVRNKIGAETFDRWHYDVSIGNRPESDPDSDHIYTATAPKRLNSKDLTRQIGLATGNIKLVSSNKVDEVVNTTLVIDGLAQELADPKLKIPKTVQKKVLVLATRKVKEIKKDIDNSFVDEVNVAADKIADNRTEEVREQAEVQRKASREARETYERKSKVTEAMQKRLPMFMTKAEYRIIRGCLKSDRVADDLKPRFDKAYAIFERLAEGGAWDE